jgi:hypothetical protein
VGGPGGEPSAYADRPEFGVECGDGFGDLFTGVVVSCGAALGVGGDKVGSGGHQRFLVLAGCGPLGDRFGVEVPALAALHHPQLAGFLRAGAALVLTGRSAGDGHHLDAAGGGVDPTHGQRSDADAMLLSQGLGNVGAQRQGGPLRPGHSRGVMGGGGCRGHQAVTSRRVLTCRNASSERVAVASGARSTPMRHLVKGIPP